MGVAVDTSLLVVSQQSSLVHVACLAWVAASHLVAFLLQVAAGKVHRRVSVHLECQWFYWQENLFLVQPLEALEV